MVIVVFNVQSINLILGIGAEPAPMRSGLPPTRELTPLPGASVRHPLLLLLENCAKSHVGSLYTATARSPLWLISKN